MGAIDQALRRSSGAAAAYLEHGLHARVQVGGQTVAVEADAVLQALHLAQPLQAIPRRRGAVAGACASRWGVLPVIDLARWLDLGVPKTTGTQVLVLQAGGKRLAVRINGMSGVQPAVDRRRLHQDDDPQELFESVVQWRDGSLAALLEVGRLAALTATWCDGADTAFSGSAPQLALGGITDTACTPHAVLRAGGRLWAVPAHALLKVVPAAPLELALNTGSAVRGICAWNGRKMPVVDLPALQCPTAAPAAGSLMAILSDGDLCISAPVEGIERLAALPRLDEQAEAALLQPGLLPDLGEVTRVHVRQLLAMLPEAAISRGPQGPGHSDTGAVTGREGWRAGSAPYLLFDCGATYAAPVTPVVRLLALDSALAHRLAAGEQATLAFEGEAIRLVALASSRFASAPSPAAAIVVGLPDGSRMALGVQGIKGWANAQAVQAGVLRSPALGQMHTITLTRDGTRSTHAVVDLCEVAQALAGTPPNQAPTATLQDLIGQK